MHSNQLILKQLGQNSFTWNETKCSKTHPYQWLGSAKLDSMILRVFSTLNYSLGLSCALLRVLNLQQAVDDFHIYASAKTVLLQSFLKRRRVIKGGTVRPIC